MKNIFIVCSDDSGVELAEKLIKSGEDHTVRLISPSKTLPIKRSLLPEIISGQVNPEDAVAQPESWFKQNKIDLVVEQELTRINPGRKRLFFSDRSQEEYDLLILAELTKARLPDIKGNTKNGVFGLDISEDVVTITETLPMIDALSIEGDSLEGLRIAVAAVDLGREVNLCVSEECAWLKAFGGEEQQVLDVLALKGLNVIKGISIQEILGDADCKAVRLSSGKVIASDMVIYTTTEPDYRIFSDEDITIAKALNFEEQYCTDRDGIFAYGKMKHADKIDNIGLNIASVLRHGAEGVYDQIINADKVKPVESVDQGEELSWQGLILRWKEGGAIFEDTKEMAVAAVGEGANDPDEKTENCREAPSEL